jgi:aminoglycoside phosphotransferase (APT) family kinase protein
VITVTVNTVTITNDRASVLLAALGRDSGLGDLSHKSSPRQLGGGFWAEILTFTLASAPPPLAGELVAKLAPSRSHGEREATIQAAIAEHGFPAPPVLVSGPGPQADGWYFVMPKVEGTPPLSAATPAALIRAVPALALRLPNLLADLGARLHALDPEPLGKELRSRTDWTVDVDDLINDIATASDTLEDRTLADDINKVLAARPLDDDQSVICHGDFHPLNIIVGNEGATVVDWTAARLGPPAFDIAFTALLLANPPIQVGPALQRPLQLAGRWLARRFVAGYRKQARAAGWDLPAERLNWYTRLHAARISLDAAKLDSTSDHPYAMLTGAARELVNA